MARDVGADLRQRVQRLRLAEAARNLVAGAQTVGDK